MPDLSNSRPGAPPFLHGRPPEVEVLLRCACQQVPQSSANRIVELCRAPTFRWNALASAATEHGLGPLVSTRLLEIGAAADCVPPAVKTRWRDEKTRILLRKKKQAADARRMIAFFMGRGTRVMLVKGAALDAVVYDEPWYVRSLDADLLVDQAWRDVDVATRHTLVELGLDQSAADVDFARHHDLDMNRVLDIDYPRMWREARTIAYLDAQVYVMSWEDMLLAACVNLCRKRFRLLKGIMAVRELILANPNLDWDKLVQIASAAGASRIAWVALDITDQVLGCEVPGRTRDALRHGDLRSPVLHALGRKVNAWTLQIPVPMRETLLLRVMSELLRLGSYRNGQLPREFRAQRELRRMKRADWYLPRPQR